MSEEEGTEPESASEERQPSNPDPAQAGRSGSLGRRGEPGQVPSQDDPETLGEESLPIDVLDDPRVREVVLAAAQIISYESEFSGPVPHPETLQQYNQALPNGAERIVSLAERQSEHRQSLERDMVATDNKLRLRGQSMGFALALVGLAGGLLIIAVGESLWGLAPVIIAVGTLVGLFLYGQRQQEAAAPTESSSDEEDTTGA